MKTITLCFLLVVQLHAFSQNDQLPFANEVRQFAKMDSLEPPPSNAIVFVGSSSFRMWHGMKDSFPSFKLINRGFGGSTLVDVLRYQQQTILKYQPSQVIIYCGENDLASSDTVQASHVIQRFMKLFSNIREAYPGIPIAFVAMKPSPSRWHLRGKYILGNNLVKQFLETHENTAYIDVWNPMLNEKGEPNRSLFIQDDLHMNAKGYALWKNIIEPYLLK